MRFIARYLRPFASPFCVLLLGLLLLAQVDQGAVTGVTKDSTGATIPTPQ